MSRCSPCAAIIGISRGGGKSGLPEAIKFDQRYARESVFKQRGPFLLEMISKAPDSETPAPGDSSSPARRLSRLRTLVIGAVVGFAVAVVALGAVLIFTRAAKAPRLSEADYRAALERWEQHGPKSYDLDLELSGNRPGTVHVEVRDGEVTHMMRDGVEPTQRRTWYYWSVLGMFDTIGEELEMARDPAVSFHNPAASQMVMWAEFDAALGYPRRYDRVVLGADFEVHWRVTHFVAIQEKN